jgi:CheY-like chemotaxis protein
MNPPATMRAVLIVEDQKECRLAAKWFLANFGYSVDTARSAEEALQQFNPKLHDAVITDSMPDMSSSDLARAIKLRSRQTPVLLYSGQIPADCSGLDVVLQRPTHLLVLKEALDRLVHRESVADDIFH